MTEAADTPTNTSPRLRRMLWAIVAAVLLIIVVGCGNDDDNGAPTVSFDGESATYDGPSTFDAGEVTFTFDSTDYEPEVAFIIAKITDPSLTLEDLQALAADAVASGPTPPWVGTFELVFANEVEVERTLELEEGRYSLNAHTGPTDTDRVYIATIIEVE